jgi:hypothetical protein
LIKPDGRYTTPTRIADDGTGFIVHGDAKLTAFLELQKALDFVNGRIRTFDI